jgi:spore maturation protein CgeB
VIALRKRLERPRILLAGYWVYDMYEQACARSLEALGAEVIPFKWSPYFEGIRGKAEFKYVIPGPGALRSNRDLLNLAEKVRADVVFVWRGTHIFPQTVRRLKAGGAMLTSFNNDDPFSPHYRTGSMHLRRLWRYYKPAIPEYDVHFVYREQNVAEMYAAGAKHVAVLPSYYVPELHRRMPLSPEDAARFDSDITFVGHDEVPRMEYLRRLVAAGLKVRLFGPTAFWTPQKLGDMADYFGDVRPVFGDDYARAISGAKMGLCAFSRLNRDDYTRRVFEIPACGSMLLCERTDHMRRLYIEDQEAVYFDSADELVEKARALVAEPDRLNRIGAAGHRRCITSGYDVQSRMKHYLETLRAFAAADASAYIEPPLRHTGTQV